MMVVNQSTNTIAAGATRIRRRLASLQAGDHVRIDNSWALASRPITDTRFRRLPSTQARLEPVPANGKPIYPQRKVLVGPTAFYNAAGSHDFTGKIHGKMIVMQTSLDSDAYPWPADWYRRFKIDPAGEKPRTSDSGFMTTPTTLQRLTLTGSVT